ncbi:MAG: GntR family transcriptional regulator [Reichenbachiella sp.]
MLLEINEASSLPKYKQLIQSIKESIESGRIKYGQKLPSINQLSFDYYLSRDTVEKAYKELKKKGFIESVKGKGYYVTNSAPESKFNVLVIFNKISAYKKVIYNSIAHNLGDKAQIDFFIYHNDYETFERFIQERLEGYHYYVIMPHFMDYNRKSLFELLSQINQEKLIFLDTIVEDIKNYKGAVYQDFKMDIFETLGKANDLLKKYKKLVLVFPDNEIYTYPKEIELGFRKFCGFNNYEYQIIDGIIEITKIEANTAYIVIEENDLVNLIKIIRSKKMKLAEEIGILSYNDTVLKEVLAEGISVISTDFYEMGEHAANIILGKESGIIKNNFEFIQRNSL